jgi:hypothetical protein
VEAALFDLTLIIRAIRTLRDELETRLAADTGLQKRFLDGDTSVADEATLVACSRLGVRPEDYRRIIDSMPALIWLESETIREAFVGSTDPGPYDVLSPESPSSWLPEEIK